MDIIDLNEKYEKLYCMCLEDWSDEIKEAGDHKWDWYQKMKNAGLRVKLALDERGEVGGMIQYGPIERAFAAGEGLYFIYCIWVHGYAKKGRGNFQKKGMGKALLAAAEEDARTLGAKGMAAWGMLLPVFMRASWFRKRGYVMADRTGLQALLWKPFTPDAKKPSWIRSRKKPSAEPGKVTVTVFWNGWCPAMNLTYERARRAAAELGDRVFFQEVNTFEPGTLREWGQADALFVDGRQVRTGPPPSFEKIKKIIAKKVKKLRN